MNILILCTGNSCRSQMAEGFLRALAPDWRVCSAGTRPSDAVHPLAIQVMLEKEIDLSPHQPKAIDLYLNDSWDLVWTVCGGAKEACPSFLGEVKARIHIGFEDPADFSGSAPEILKGFRQIRDEIAEVCQKLAHQYSKGTPI